MSEFTENYKNRVNKLQNYVLGLIDGKNGTQLIQEYQILDTQFKPDDIFMLFDRLFDAGIDIEKIVYPNSNPMNIARILLCLF